MVTKANIKCKVLAVSEKLGLIKNQQLCMPLLTLNIDMENKKNILAMHNYSTRWKNVKTSQCEKIKVVLLECYRQKQAQYTPIQCPMLRQKAKEIALKLHIVFTP
jgi:hypothetical protein